MELFPKPNIPEKGSIFRIDPQSTSNILYELTYNQYTRLINILSHQIKILFIYLLKKGLFLQRNVETLTHMDPQPYGWHFEVKCGASLALYVFCYHLNSELNWTYFTAFMDILQGYLIAFMESQLQNTHYSSTIQTPCMPCCKKYVQLS